MFSLKDGTVFAFEDRRDGCVDLISNKDLTRNLEEKTTYEAQDHRFEAVSAGRAKKQGETLLEHFLQSKRCHGKKERCFWMQ